MEECDDFLGAGHVDVNNMVEAAPTKDGWVDHLDPVGHGDDQHAGFDRFWDAPQEFGDLLHPIMAAASTGLTIGEECFHFVDDHKGRGILDRLVEDFGDLLTRVMYVGTGHARGVDLEAWPAQ